MKTSFKVVAALAFIAGLTASALPGCKKDGQGPVKAGHPAPRMEHKPDSSGGQEPPVLPK